MKIMKRILIGLAALIMLLAAVYYMFPGFIVDTGIRFARFSTGLERHEVMAGNIRWAYLDGGKGETVIIIHGFTGNKDILGTMPSAFIKSYRVIAPDLPGGGETGYIDGADYTITGAAEAFEEFIKSMKIESFHLVGLSSSGAIAAYYASKYPSRVKTLSIMGPFGIQSQIRSDFQKVYDKGENPLAVRTPAEFDLKMSYIAYKPVVIPAHIKAYIAKESAKMYEFHKMVFKNEIDTEGWDMLREHLKNIESPTLVIFGDKDRFVDVSCIDVFKKEIKNVKAYVMKDAGHVTYMDKPEETNRVIIDFIKANAGR